MRNNVSIIVGIPAPLTRRLQLLHDDGSTRVLITPYLLDYSTPNFFLVN